MKPRNVILWIAAYMVIIVGACMQPEIGIDAVVERVIDGDTIVVRYVDRSEHVRLLGVDAPELTSPTVPLNEGDTGGAGQAAKQYMEGLLPVGTRMLVQLDKTAGMNDRFGRLLAYVYLPDGRMVNREIIRAGYARVLTRYPFEKREEFKHFNQP